ncbi:nephronectin isoform X1 [Siniperca chuatsi]|uniref:nephronectin isoform X1 n=1 Tax=Siniperca chuatsi TaxID=119488 RepID=UPI001CE1DE57|nr:nephronectin isoform X1 [Siniperca chuatsi]
MLTRIRLVLLSSFWVWIRGQRLDHVRDYTCKQKHEHNIHYSRAPSSDGLCRYGNGVECCWGWRQMDWDGRCQPHCQHGCKHGECVGPDRCKCHPGYTGKACNQDLNECGVKPRPCKHRCMNTPGSYKCYCLDGYTLQPDGSCRNARTCYHANCQYGCEVIKGEVRCTCPSPGLRLGPDRRTCVDIDECALGGGVCPRRRKCVNTFGSFVCKCHLGFKLTYINGRYTCIDKDTRPFCSLNPASPKCRCKDGSCKAVLKVTVEPHRPRTTSPTPARTTTPITTTAATPLTTAPLTTTTPPTTPFTTTPPTTPFTTPPPPTTTTTTPTTTTSPTTTPPPPPTTTPFTTTTSPTTTTTPPPPTTTTTPFTTTTSPTTTTPPPPITTTPPPTTTTFTPPPPRTTTPPPTTPPPTTPTPLTTTPLTTTPVTTATASTTTSAPTTTTELDTTTTTTTTTTVEPTTAATVAPTTTMATTSSLVTTTVNNRINTELTHRQRGDVHIPRLPDHNQVWEFDIELGNTSEDARDDPAAGVLHCTFDHGACDWMSDRDGDLHWETAHDPAGGRYLSVPELKAGQRSIRGARLAVQIVPPWSHGDLCFSFSHWLTGRHVGVLQLFIRKRGRDQRYSPALWSRTGGHGWRQTRVTLTTHSLERVLLKAERRKGQRGQIAVDDVTLRQGACR